MQLPLDDVCSHQKIMYNNFQVLSTCFALRYLSKGGTGRRASAGVATGGLSSISASIFKDTDDIESMSDLLPLVSDEINKDRSFI